MFSRRLNIVLGVLAVLAASTCVAVRAEAPFSYPKAKMGDVVDDLHGVKVSDPYRWMEDLDGAELKEWIEAENKITFGYLNTIPRRSTIRERITQLWDYEKFGIPYKKGGYYFFTKNDGLQNQSVLYVTKSLDDEAKVLLDPNKLSEDGTVALSGYSFTDDGKRMAYGVSDAGSDWVEYRVRDVSSGKDFSDHLKWIKFSGASWTKDGEGFFYSRYDEPADKTALQDANYFQKLFYHNLGDPQSKDTLIYDRPDHKDWGFGGTATDDGQYLVISIWQGTERKNRIYYRDIQANDGAVVKLLDDFDAQYSFIDNDGPLFWFYTDLDAPKGRVIGIDVTNPAKENWKELIPESKHTLRGVGMVNNQFAASYLQDAYSNIKIFDTDGKHVRDVELPGIGSAGGFSGKRSDTDTFYSYSSFNTPPQIYHYDMASGKSTLFKNAEVEFDPKKFMTKQVFYHSKDGTRIPMFITHKKGLKLNGKNPTYLYGYGGFNISLTPRFSVTNLVWMEMGGVYAQANIRGGGEYGKEWHNAGKLTNKQNCFDDFIAAAEWLIDKKFTGSQKLAIGGGSNGGLLVGACMTQRPDLFAAALPAVGVLDMFRFQKFTIGWAWTSDYGSSDDEEMFKVQAKYSPYHNLKAGTRYPSTMITTADHDDRVVPSHSFKFAAALQAAHRGDNPVLIRVETRAGHGAGKPTGKRIEEAADKWAFLVRELNMDAE